jgi:hypothetical protein
MGQATDGQLPFDTLGYRAEGVYVPNVGTVAQQGATLGTDSQGTNYAATVVTTASGSTTAISATNTGLPVNLPTIVQKANAVSTGSVASLAKAFTNSNTAGNSIVVVAGCGNGTAMTVADSAGNTYVQAVNAPNSTTFEAAIFYTTNIAGGANTVTVTNAGTAASMAVEIYEISGLIAQSGAVLGQAVTNTGTGTSATAANIAAGVPNELAFMGVAVGTAAQAVSATSGTFWTLDSTQNSGGTPAGLFSFGALNQPIGSLKSVQPAATLAGSEPFAVAAATFRPVALGVSGSVAIAGSNYTNITSKTTTVVKTGPGVLKSIIINKAGSADTLTIYDNTAGSGTTIGTITVTASVNFVFNYEAAFSTGLTIVSGGTTAGDYTVIWR